MENLEPKKIKGLTKLSSFEVSDKKNLVGGISGRLYQSALAGFESFGSGGGGWKYDIPCVDVPWFNDFGSGGDGWSGLVDCNCVMDLYKARWKLGMFAW